MQDQKQTIRALTPLLNVRDVSRSIAFYSDALGFDTVAKWEPDGRLGWARLKAGSVELMLNTSELSAEDEQGTEQRSGRSSFSDGVLYFDVPDADALHVRLLELGFKPSEPFDAEYGLREFHMRDYDGYELAFTSPLRSS
jgi:uncharacterized glyoxalase superfamily protein PhnB